VAMRRYYRTIFVIGTSREQADVSRGDADEPSHYPVGCVTMTFP